MCVDAPNFAPLERTVTRLSSTGPGSAFEFIDVIKILRKSASPKFHLIAPSQIGYGWSSPPPLDFGVYESARVLSTLMVGLGFGSYAVQGGDIGSVLARIMSVRYL